MLSSQDAEIVDEEAAAVFGRRVTAGSGFEMVQ